MIAKLLNAILNLLISIISIPIGLIDNFIQQVLPDLSSALNLIGDFFTYISQFSPLVVSYTGLYPATIGIIVSMIVATVMLPLTVEGVKLAVKWFDKLKLG